VGGVTGGVTTGGVTGGGGAGGGVGVVVLSTDCHSLIAELSLATMSERCSSLRVTLSSV
jgi:hypothetical protein